jgi:hypothetical protein
MKRNEIEKKILQQHSELLQTNLEKLSKAHLESWVQDNEITLTASVLVNIFAERNKRAEINSKLNRTNFGLNAKLKSLGVTLTNWSKSELIKGFKDIFGTVTKTDDQLLGEIGAVSKVTVIEDLGRAEAIITDAQDIADQYRNKYGEL